MGLQEDLRKAQQRFEGKRSPFSQNKPTPKQIIDYVEQRQSDVKEEEANDDSPIFTQVGSKRKSREYKAQQQLYAEIIHEEGVPPIS